MQKGYIEAGDRPRRFYNEVAVAEGQAGFGVTLDGKSLRTPKGAPLSLPTRGLAALIAEEWSRQDEILDQAGMHATRLANTALEAVSQAREAVADQVAAYAGSDVLCYFADAPAGLVAREIELWTPWLERAERDLDLKFVRVEGIIHEEQPPETLARVRALALESDDFTLAGLAFGMSLFGSAILSLAVQRGWLGGEAAFDLSRLDEAWQEQQWGVDEEAAERTARLRIEAAVLERWFKAVAEA